MIHKRPNGKYVIADYIVTKSRFVTRFTKRRTKSEASHLDALKDAVEYSSESSAKRAIRKFKNL